MAFYKEFWGILQVKKAIEKELKVDYCSKNMVSRSVIEKHKNDFKRKIL